VLYQALLEQMDTLVDEVTDECDSAYARGRAVVARVFKLTEQDPSRFGPALRLITLRLDRVLPNSVDGYADSVWDSAWLAVRSGNGADGA
jgi:hypothetical protein